LSFATLTTSDEWIAIHAVYLPKNDLDLAGNEIFPVPIPVALKGPDGLNYVAEKGSMKRPLAVTRRWRFRPYFGNQGYIWRIFCQ
jgi:hypothetical protein